MSTIPAAFCASQFTGKERDSSPSETGLDYFGARYYASPMGRWMSPDWASGPVPVPYADLTNPQSLNIYAYISNNPVTGIDPDGHMRAEMSGWGHTEYAPHGGISLEFTTSATWGTQEIDDSTLANTNVTDLVGSAAADIGTIQVSEKDAQTQDIAGNMKRSTNSYWEYSQYTGQMTHVLSDGSRVKVGKPGYAGTGSGRNNPNSQDVSVADDPKNAGPLPRGSYIIGPQQLNVTGMGKKLRASMRLTQIDGESYGRSGFIIHGDNKTHTASEGCPVLAPDVRDQIGRSTDKLLRVVQ